MDLFSYKTPSRCNGRASERTQSVLDDLGDVCVEELLPFGLGRVPQFFGVRLDADGEVGPGRFDDLDHTVCGGTDHTERRRDVAYRLVVHAVGLDDGLFEGFGQPAVFADLDFVGQDFAVFEIGRERVIEATGDFGGDVLEQRAAQCHIEHLVTAADPQDGLAVGSCALGQIDFGAVLLEVVAAQFGVRGVPVGVGMDVDAAGQQEAVDDTVQAIEDLAVFGGRQEQRHAAGMFDSADVGLRVAERQAAPFVTRVGARDSDDGTLRH